jgi:hypothetical protein
LWVATTAGLALTILASFSELTGVTLKDLFGSTESLQLSARQTSTQGKVAVSASDQGTIDWHGDVLQDGSTKIVNLPQEVAEGPTYEPAGLAFASISLHTIPHWREFHEPSSPYPFDVQADRFFGLTVWNSPVDPSFDVTLVNRSNTPHVLQAVGMEIVNVAKIWEEIGGSPPAAIKVRTEATYTIEISDLRIEELLTKPVLIDNRVHQFSISELHKLVFVQVHDPVYLQSLAPFRYVLQLRNYRKYIPNHALVRLWVRTDLTESSSHIIHICRDSISRQSPCPNGRF